MSMRMINEAVGQQGLGSFFNHVYDRSEFCRFGTGHLGNGYVPPRRRG